MKTQSRGCLRNYVLAVLAALAVASAFAWASLASGAPPSLSVAKTTDDGRLLIKVDAPAGTILKWDTVTAHSSGWNLRLLVVEGNRIVAYDYPLSVGSGPGPGPTPPPPPPTPSGLEQAVVTAAAKMPPAVTKDEVLKVAEVYRQIAGNIPASLNASETIIEATRKAREAPTITAAANLPAWSEWSKEVGGWINAQPAEQQADVNWVKARWLEIAAGLTRAAEGRP